MIIMIQGNDIRISIDGNEEGCAMRSAFNCMKQLVLELSSDRPIHRSYTQ